MKKIILALLCVLLLVTPSCRAVRDSSTVGGSAAVGAIVGTLVLPGVGAPIGAAVFALVTEAFVLIRHDEEVRKDESAGRRPETSIPKAIANAARDAAEGEGSSILSSVWKWAVGLIALVVLMGIMLYHRSRKARVLMQVEIAHAEDLISKAEHPNALS